MSRSRSASFGACSDTASATGHSSRRRSIIGTMPEVDSVTRRRERPYASSSIISFSAATVASTFSNGPALPHDTLVAEHALPPGPRPERGVREPQLPDDLAGREVAVESLSSRRAELAGERAPRLRRDAQRSARGLGYEHRLHRVS